LFKGAEQVDLFYYGAAHTNGDSFVVFKSARAMHSGDAFANKGQPFIDRDNGGSGVAYAATLKAAAKGIKNVDTVIPGHSPVTKWADFVEFGEFNQLFLDHARTSLAANKTPEQAMKDFTLPEKFKGYNLAGGRGGPGGNFGVIFEELKAK
jgi:glyoxylase-like metal-dependent hydrolase (beta-lactamase superfamily II)